MKKWMISWKEPNHLKELIYWHCLAKNKKKWGKEQKGGFFGMLLGI